MRFDNQGWLTEGANIDPSPNFTDVQNPRHLIVMHYTASYQAPSAIATFKIKRKPRSSAHFIVETDGGITQMVATGKVAWHAGGGVYRGKTNVNSFSVGIEIVNPGYHFEKTGGGYLNWARKPVRESQLRPFPGMTTHFDPWVGSTAFWPNFPSAQLDAVEKLTVGLLKAYPTISEIVGHRDVDSVRRMKVDPGPAFPMLRFRKLLDSRREKDDPIYAAKVARADKLNVRGGPASTFDTLDWGPLRVGDFVEVHHRDGDWDYIRRYIDGVPREGWVHSAYLDPR